MSTSFQLQPKSFRLVVATFCALFVASVAIAGDLVQLPLKWCAVDGSPAVVNPSAAPPNPYTGDPEPDTDAVLWRRHERASDNIWIPGADITFRSGFTADVRDNADFPIISDPCPPATATLCQGGDNQGMSCTPDGVGEDAAVCGAGVTCATQSCPGACTLDGTGLDACLGNVGDLTGVGTYCQGGTANGQGCSPDNSGEDAGICGAGVTCARDLLEYNLATAACDAAWDDLQDTWDTPLPGQIAVNIHRFRNPDGNLDGLKGRATGSAFNAGASLCDMPPTGVTSASGGAVIGIDNQNFASSESGSNIAFEENNERMIAHELGHNVFLWHGDGLDNDGNGVFDQACDSAENTCLAPTTFMSSSSCGSYSTAMTSDQGDHAGIVAAQYDGQVTDPPNQLIAGPVISDGRTDPPLDVEDGQIDLTRVMVLDDRGQERTEVLHFTREPVTADTGVAREYLTLIDLDGLPETGGEPASIGFPSELAGADLALKVRYTRPPGSEFPSPVPTIWFARDGEWAECSTDFSRFCGLVRAEIRPMLGGDDDLDRRDLHRPTVSGTAVAITFPSRLRSDFTQASRLQAIAQVIKLGPPDEVVEIDRLPQHADRARAIRVREARYPICGVEPTSARPGEFVTLLAEDMQSNVAVKAFVGDRRVGEGQTDANGAVSISIQVPFETPRGMRLVTIGVMNQALSADCPLEVRGEPVARPAYEYAAKMICGVQKDPRGQVLARGFYTTVLNLRNTGRGTARIEKTLALAIPPGKQEPGKVIPFAVDSLPSGAALAVDCDDLRERAFGGKLPAGLIDGFIVVRSTERLDAEAVYSTATLNAEGSAEDHSSIDVRRVQARKVDSTRPPRARPNLVVLAIDEIDVDCPAGAGSCVTKARARLANVSANPAGTFAARAILDPKQSVEVNQSFPGGLMPGNETDFLIVTPPGDNCFNPDCTICVTVDPDDLVAESDETDNQLCVTTQG